MTMLQWKISHLLHSQLNMQPGFLTKGYL
ncbi:hypothetical protein NC652_009305 [Populus alba x Populus x berolinensis]|nr:hypothetical protein NC652_009305 [Populus alba x Populus x berolinensis]